MALELETEAECSIKRRKRETMQSERELAVGSRVEVRSLEDGFLGSWHLGTVIACCPQRWWEVSYDYCLADDWSDKLKESVPITVTADGLNCGGNNSNCSNYRGRIRPFPPDVAQDSSGLLYGLCVDVHYADAWWEGVIFDSRVGAQERQIFFPDLGDQLVANIRNIRVSQEWIEGDGSWLRRGFWSFLKVIQKYEEQFSLPISVKQIWYDLRQKEGFRNIEWTCDNELLWGKMVFSTLSENLRIALSCILPPFAPQGELAREQRAKIQFPEPPMITSTNASNRLCIVPDGSWQPVDLVPEPACFPDPFASYLVDQTDQSSDSARMVLKKHMAYLGWKIESKFSCNLTRMRYTSPDGKYYYSLLQVCRAQCGKTELISASSCEDVPENLITPTRHPLSSSSSPSENSKVCKDPVSSEALICDDCDHTPAYCPQSVIDYYALQLEQLRSEVAGELRWKVKQELSAIGWTLSSRKRKGRDEMVYTSPGGINYFSLRMACRGCIEDCGMQELTSGTEDLVNTGEEVEMKFPSNKSSLSVGRGSSQKALLPLKTKKVESGQKLRRLKNEPTRHLRLQIKSSGALVKPKHEKERSRPTRAVKSSKKVQNIVPRSFPQSTKTVLSWLMDNDILLPRTKVYCRRDSGCSSLAEGRAHRDGIRCTCCNELFSLSGFISHSGCNFCSPAARIFLEDGRSLQDCQVQIYRKRSYLMEDTSDRMIHKSYEEKGPDNDYLCSVCHYGGDLILCDQCPSSFHKTCLGLEDVPDGDWFCPSCCCGICGDGRLREEIGQSTNVSIVNCYQCEHKYHILCLMKNRAAEQEDHLRGNWYCSKKCEQIHEGLLELEGKQVKLGLDNLTVTFLKPVNCKRHDDADIHMKSAAENYVKLKLALDVMHECFEPVTEPHSCRDLIEDVIFNRGSELNRFNFRGFYTVLLEKNDELITVATIRIHGEKVAEVPLVGTRFQFRRLGMCRALMNALEKKLKELGVERIALPAVPSALNTWTGSFGFTEMTESERLQFVDHIFLNFPDTIMCQKQLLDVPPIKSTISSGNCQLKLADHLKGSPDTELEGSSTVSEEFQGKPMEGSEIVEQGTVAAVKDADESGGSVHEVNKVCEPSQPDRKQSFTENFPECSTTGADSDEKCNTERSDRVLRCYQRRRLCKDSS